jgi:DNA gyrase subunit B
MALEYQRLSALGRRFDSKLPPETVVKRGEKKHEVATLEDCMIWLLDEARRGTSVQRYKGLGEMNPDQLWETTMNMETRSLMQVTVEDAVATDQMFTILMGEEVEPRRDFIERNALTVRDIDT